MPIFRIKPEWMTGENTPQTANTALSGGEFGNLETVEAMKRVARLRSSHPLVRELALNILNWHKIKSHDYKNEAIAIARFVKEKVRYVRDIKNIEQLHDPLTMIEQIRRGVARGDCDDMSLLIATLLLSIGHQPFFRIVKYKSNIGSFNHIYVVEYEHNGSEKRKRIALDAILKDKPIGYEIKHKYGKEIAA